MAKETAARIEQMEKSQQELWEILVKDREEHCEHMAQMMQIIMRIAREKRTVDELILWIPLLEPNRLLKALWILLLTP